MISLQYNIALHLRHSTRRHLNALIESQPTQGHSLHTVLRCIAHTLDGAFITPSEVRVSPFLFSMYPGIKAGSNVCTPK